MKICIKCRKQVKVIHEGKGLCYTHYNLIPIVKEKPKPKKEVSINDYILL